MKNCCTLINVLLGLSLALGSGQAQPREELKYVAQTPPGKTPQIFAPGIISKENEHEFGSVFSKDGREIFYGVDNFGKSEIRYAKLEDSKWTIPVTIISHAEYGYNDPFLSPDETELYYISNQPAEADGDKKDHDIWYSQLQKDGSWSDPINPGANINSARNEYYMSFLSDGTMFFGSNVNAEEGAQYNYDIYKSARINGEYQPAENLGPAINTPRYEADVYVAPDESYVIFCAIRREGLGNGDLYISFKNKDGTWTPSKNMGAPISTEHHELCPFVTVDGKYLFYTSNQDIYWVDASVIESLK